MAKYDNDSNNTITISLLPKEYIDKYGHITVHLPSGKKLPLREAYTQYGPTHIKRSDIPYLTDFLITQLLLDDATTREIKKEQADRNIHTNFNMTTPDSEGLHNLNRVVSPILKGAAVAGGLAYALPAASSGITNWALTNPTLARQLYTGALGGGAFDISSILGGYDDFGHLMYTATGGKNWENVPDWQKFLWNFTNLGYTASAKPIKTAETLGEQALRQTFEGIPINPTVRDLAKAMNQLTKNSTYKTTELFPGTIGWAPRQTLTGYHASNKPIQEFNYWFPNWAVKEHNAPYGVYFTANEIRPSGGFLAKRPYIEQVSSTFDKPIVQVGEIPASAKNATRNSIERQAQSMGADGIVYQGIKDNQLENQTIVKALNPDLRVNVSKIIENDPQKPLNSHLLGEAYLKDSFGKERPQQYFEAVSDQEPGNISVHFKTDGRGSLGSLTTADKQALFTGLNEVIPEGSRVSTYGQVSPGGVHGLNRLAQENGYTQVSTRMVQDKAGNPLEIPIFEKPISRITAENAAKITPEQWTAAQDAAITRGDMVEALRLRDLHFSIKAPNTVIRDINGNPVHLYHGTMNKGWTSYDPKKFGTATDDGMYGKGLYATTRKGYADTYARGYTTDGSYVGETKDLYVNGLNPFYIYIRGMNPQEIAERESAAYQFNRAKSMKGDISTSIWNEMNNSDIIIEEFSPKHAKFSEVVIPKGEQIKLADAVTYDDLGQRIPLGERDNFNINDLRYVLGLPLVSSILLSNINNRK